jgi:hypothetical protein
MKRTTARPGATLGLAIPALGAQELSNLLLDLIGFRETVVL